MLFIKAFTSYFHIYRPPTPPTVPSPIVRHHHLIAPTAQYTAIGEKTAEERFNMLARGWLAYPVTPTHHTSTAEERLYKRHPGKTHFGDAPYAESGASVSRKPRSSP